VVESGIIGTEMGTHRRYENGRSAWNAFVIPPRNSYQYISACEDICEGRHD
jgi:hypothetical protein